MTDPLAYSLAVTIMVIGVVCAVLPFTPGPPIVWLGALFYGWQTHWQGIGWLVLLLLLLVAVVGSTSDWWLNVLFLKGSGGSPWAILGSLVGGIIGSFAIPIPVFGTVVGSLLGVLAIEWSRRRELGHIFRVGRGFLVSWLLSLLVQAVASGAMIVLFLQLAH